MNTSNNALYSRFSETVFFLTLEVKEHLESDESEQLNNYAHVRRRRADSDVYEHL